jgi:flagellar hook-basal body complex protein FliE
VTAYGLENLLREKCESSRANFESLLSQSIKDLDNSRSELEAMKKDFLKERVLIDALER